MALRERKAGGLLRSMVRLLVCLAATSLGGPLVTSTVSAQVAGEPARNRARELGYAGVKAYQAGDYAVANKQLEQAYELLRAPSLGLWSARTLVRLGKLVEASERYLEVSQLPVSAGKPTVQERARAEAIQEHSALKAKIPSLTFRVTGAPPSEVEVNLDDVAVPRAAVNEPRLVNPGRHRVEARHAEKLVRTTVNLAEGMSREVVLDFVTASQSQPPTAVETPPPPPASSRPRARSDPTRTLAYVAFGVGGAGIAFGALTGLLAVAKKSELDDSGSCRNNACLRSESESVASYHSLRTLSTVGFLGGVAFGATGAVLLLVESAADKRSDSAFINLQLSPEGAWLRGAF